MFTCFQAVSSIGKKIDSDAHLKPKKHDISLVQFKNFVKLFMDNIEENECEEMFMLLTKKL